MKISQIPHNPKILLYGYGLEGKSSEAWLKRQFLDCIVEVYEDGQRTPRPAGTPLEPRGEEAETLNKNPLASPQIKNKSISLPALDKEGIEGGLNWEKYDLIVKSPGVPPSSIPDAYWPKVTSNLRLFLENLNAAQRAKVIGITGSKGKSTTAKFTHELLQTAGLKSVIIGNYGVPALEAWDQLQTLDFVVAECSSFQLYDLTVSPKYAIFLSFFADHLDWHDSDEDAYFRSKENLWFHQEAEDYLLVASPISNFKFQILNKGTLKETAAVESDLFPPDSTLQAAHFRQNLGTVWQLAEALNIPDLKQNWKTTAAQFAMIEHRLEDFLTRDGFTFYNDSIATSPDATIKGVEYLGKNLAGLMLDGQDTGLDGCEALAETLETQAPQARVALVQSDIADSFKKVKSSLVVQSFEDYETALTWLLEAKPGAILFSPGGKSFNRFNNYSERGRVFKELVLSLK